MLGAFHAIILAAIASALCVPSLMGATVVVVERSSPAGIISNVTTAATAQDYITVQAPVESTTNHFVQWVVNGVRQQDSWGRSLNPARFILYESVDVVAQYMPTSQDADGDGIPDWYEIVEYGAITNTSESDTDGDGFALSNEYHFSYSPHVSNSFVSGGISMRGGALTMVNVGGQFVSWSVEGSTAGVVSAQSGMIKKGLTLSTESIAPIVSGHRFGYWTVNGVRQADALGVSLTRLTVVAMTNLTIIAQVYPENQDVDTDGIPDGWEYRNFGFLTSTGDIDGDGLSLAQEYYYDLCPAISNSWVSGGVSMRGGSRAVVNLGGMCNWISKGSPSGIIGVQSGTVHSGTLVTTENIAPTVSGYRFGYWALNGVRQSDALGIALSRLSVVANTNLTMIAYFYPENQDTDADGVPDGWEYRYQDSLTNLMDADGDGFSLSNEYFNSYSPVISNSFVSGGVSMRGGTIATVNLQPFERLSHVLIDDVLTNWFTVWPTGELAGAQFGSATVPALGDWDGDGDLDVFLATSNQALHVFENIGTRYTMNFSERTDRFPQLGSLVGAVAMPFVSLGDWSGDGAADVVLGGSVGNVKGILSSGSFTSNQPAPSTWTVSMNAGNNLPVVMDLTGDDRLDLLVMQANGLIGVLTNSGNVSQPFALPFWTTNLLNVTVPNAGGISPADIDGDGADDLLVSDWDGRIWEFKRHAGAAFTLLSKVWAGSSTGFAVRPVVCAADIDGDLDFDAWIGYAQGGLTVLRDPHLGPPSNLKAVNGSDAIGLTWNPNRQSRVTGFGVYRSVVTNGDYDKLNDELLSEPMFDDRTALTGTTYFYRVTASTEAHFPGTLSGVPRESPRSEPVSGKVWFVSLWMPDFVGDRDETAVLQVNIDKADGIAGAGLDIRIVYDQDLLRPISQIDPGSETVKPTALSASMTYADNSMIASGELLILGASGYADGGGHLFDVVFGVASNAVPNTTCTNVFSHVTLFRTNGQSVVVNYSDQSVFTVTPFYQLGDITGNGVVDMDDHTMLMEFLKMDAERPSSQQLFAGDINGDGVLNHEDIPLLLRLINGDSMGPAKK